MNLSNLKPEEGSIHTPKKRLGRGQGSGKGGTASRGHNGQKSRSGYSKKLGFEGMLILHPKEIELAHEYYSPNIKEIEYARKVIDLSDKAAKKGISVTIMENKFIGPPFVKKAKKILQKYELIKLIKNKI